MTTIIPIPAFSGQLHLGRAQRRNAAVVDPGDAAPVLAWLDANGVRAVRDHRHASSRRSRRRRSRRCSRATTCRCSGPRARRFPGARTRCAKAIGSTFRASASRSSVLDIPGPHRRPHRVLHDGRRSAAVLRRHAVRRGLRPAVRRHARADVDVAVEARRAAAGHARVLRARIHAREPALRAGGRAGQRRRRARGSRASGPSAIASVPTLPSTIGDELATNPFLRAAIARRDGAPPPRTPERPMADVVDAFAALRAVEERFPLTRASRTCRVDGRGDAAYHRRDFAAIFLIEIRNECTIDDP